MVKFDRKTLDGDSGAPVWNKTTGTVAGMLSGEQEGYSFVAPLIRPKNFDVEKAPGVLSAPGIGNLDLEEAP